MSKKSKLQRGGDLLGAGTYGCVYRPPLECGYRPDLNQLYAHDAMKITDPNSVSNFTEDEISSFVRLLDPTSLYFIPLSGHYCSLKMTGSNQKELEKCGAFVKSNNKKGYRGYFMKYGGLTLYDYIKSQPIHLLTFWKWLEHSVTGLSLLISVGIVHGDIKNNNYVIHEGDLKLIDFGIAYVPEYDMIHLNYYSIYPLYYSVYYTDNIGNLYNDFEGSVKSFLPTYKKGKIDNDPILYYFEKAHSNREEYFEKIIKPNIHKLDLYCLFNMLKPIYLSNKFSFDLMNPQLSSAINELINLNIHFDPSKQIDIRQNIKLINEIKKTL